MKIYKLSGLLLVFILNVSILFAQKEYSVQDMLSFNNLSLNISLSGFIPQKKFIRDNYTKVFPYATPSFSFIYRFSRFFGGETGILFSSMKTEAIDTVSLQSYELFLNLFFFKETIHNFFVDAGISPSFDAALSESSVITVNPLKIRVGKREVNKIWYGWGIGAFLRLNYFINFYHSIGVTARYNTTFLGDPKNSGLGNLGGWFIGGCYIYTF